MSPDGDELDRARELEDVMTKDLMIKDVMIKNLMILGNR